MTPDEIKKLSDAQLSYWNDAFTVQHILVDEEVSTKYQQITMMTDEQMYAICAALDEEEEHRIMQSHDELIAAAKAETLTNDTRLKIVARRCASVLSLIKLNAPAPILDRAEYNLAEVIKKEKCNEPSGFN